MADFSRSRKTASRLISKYGSKATISRISEKGKIDPITQSEVGSPKKSIFKFMAVGKAPGKTWETRGNSLIEGVKVELSFVPDADYVPKVGDEISWGDYKWSLVDYISVSPDGSAPVVIQALVSR